MSPFISNLIHIEDVYNYYERPKRVASCDLSCHAFVAAELVGVKKRESCCFTSYFRDGTKVLRLAFIQDETSESQLSMGRLKILLQRKNRGINFNECVQKNMMSCENGFLD